MIKDICVKVMIKIQFWSTITNLMTNDVELKTNYNTLCVTKECSQIPVKGSRLSSLDSSK